MDTEDRDHFKTIASALAGPQQGSQKPPVVESSSLVRDPNYTLRKAQMIFACYRKDETQDPETYAAAVAAVLSQYPQNVIDYVCDPRTGITGTNKWLPAVAEIKDACESLMNKLWQDGAREKRIEKQLADREADYKAMKEQRKLNYAELKAKYGDGMGGWLGEGAKRKDSKEAHQLMTEEQKEAALESAAKVGQEIGTMKLSPEALKTIARENDQNSEYPDPIP